MRGGGGGKGGGGGGATFSDLLFIQNTFRYSIPEFEYFDECASSTSEYLLIGS